MRQMAYDECHGYEFWCAIEDNEDLWIMG